MEDILFLESLGGERKDLEVMLKTLSRKKANNVHQFSPADRKAACIDLTAVKMHKSWMVSNSITMSSVKAICSDIFLLEATKDLPPRYLVPLGKPTLPTTFSVCPTEREVEKDIESDRFYISFHDAVGYDFSSEFVYVYMARSGKESHFKDHLAVCRRALIAVDSSLAESDLDAFSHHIIRMTRWEMSLGPLIASSTLSQGLRDLPINVIPQRTGTKYNPCRVYIGKNSDQTLMFSIRLSFAMSKGSGYVPVPLAAAGDREEATNDKKLLDFSSVVYYRKYPLTMAAVDVLNKINTEMVGGARVPPPPPKVQSDDDIRVYLSIVETRHALLGEEAANDEVADSLPLGTNSLQKYSSVNASSGSVVDSLHMNHSPCCDLLGWGHNMFSSLGMGTAEYVSEPRPVPLPGYVPLERVSMIACSPRHSLLLTQMGSIFACGDNSEGALGTGDLLARYIYTFNYMLMLH